MGHLVEPLLPEGVFNENREVDEGPFVDADGQEFFLDEDFEGLEDFEAEEDFVPPAPSAPVPVSSLLSSLLDPLLDVDGSLVIVSESDYESDDGDYSLARVLEEAARRRPTKHMMVYYTRIKRKVSIKMV